VTWQSEAVARIPAASPGADLPFAVPVFAGDVPLIGPAGQYVFRAELESGGAAAGGCLRFFVSEQIRGAEARRQPGASSIRSRFPGGITLWGVDSNIAQWLEGQGMRCRPFQRRRSSRLVIVGDLSAGQTHAAEWDALWRSVSRGATALFLSPGAFHRDDDPAGWLSPGIAGRFSQFNDWLYHKECVSKRSPVFDGMSGPGVMDWDYYGPVISSLLFEPEQESDEVIAAAFAVGYPCEGGCTSGMMMGAYPIGSGTALINTFHILENIGKHPAADRMLINLIRWAARKARR